MIPADKWNLIRPIFDNAFKSCMHFAMATVNEDGSPHITPFGSLILREDPSGYFFDEYAPRLGKTSPEIPGYASSPLMRTDLSG